MNIGDKLFDFEVADINGNIRGPKEMYRQFALLVIFFSSKCEVSRAYASRIEKLAVNYESDHLAVFLIDTNPSDDYSLSQDFVDLKLNPYPNFIQLVDSECAVARQFGAEVSPTAYLFNRRRELVYKGLIDDNWQHPDFVMRVFLEDAIEYTLDGMDYDFPETEPVGTPINYV